jgi:hypothetical protein
VQNASRFVAVWYLARLLAVNASAAFLLQSPPGHAAQTASVHNDARTFALASFDCAAALAFTFGPPLTPPLTHGSPEVCQSALPLAAVIPPGWPIDVPIAADAFAAVDPRVKRLIALLYGGQRPRVARGWIAREHELESLTLVSPHPDRSLTCLAPGTLLIRIVTDR